VEWFVLNGKGKRSKSKSIVGSSRVHEVLSIVAGVLRVESSSVLSLRCFPASRRGPRRENYLEIWLSSLCIDQYRGNVFGRRDREIRFRGLLIGISIDREIWEAEERGEERT